MSLDTLSYAAPSRIKALILPLGRIKRSRFSLFVTRLRGSNIVRLGDVTPDSTPDRMLFSPQGFPGGQLIYDLTVSFDREHEYLESFEPYRRTYLIIAVADHTEGNGPEVLSQQLEELKFLYPRALYHTCLIFDSPPILPNPNESPGSEGSGEDRLVFIPVPAKRESRSPSMRTIMCDITSLLLAELSGLARAIQALPTIDSPLSSENQVAGASGGRDHRMSMPVGSSANLSVAGNTGAASKRVTMTGFGSASVSERARNKGKGRVNIVIASLYLLAGRTPDALKEFVEGGNVAKSNNDHLWHGKALEGIGICLAILVHLKVDFQMPLIPYPTVEVTKATKSSPSNSKPVTPSPDPGGAPDAALSTSPAKVDELLGELLEIILNLYTRSANFAGESIPQICFSETVIRFSKLRAATYTTGGLNDESLDHVIFGKPLPPGRNQKIIPYRAEISTLVMRGYPFPLESLTVLDATRVLSGIASILGMVGSRRRKALVTRELVKILIPGLIQARVVGAAEVGVHPAAGLSAVSGGALGGSPLDLGEGDAESGVMELLEDLCRAYGVFPGKSNSDKSPSTAEKMESGDEVIISSLATAEVIAEQEIRAFGWPALKIHVLRNCTALCEALPDFHGVLQFTTQLLRTADADLTKEEQIRLSTTISRTVGAARKLGLPNVEADYWDQFLLRDVEVVENSMWRPPISHSKNELIGADSDTPPSAPIEVDKNPFIYNPFLKKAEAAVAEPVLVKGEAAEFRVTLQNPFEFDIEIESVTLDATGVGLEAQKVGVVINPYRTYQVAVYATPQESGNIRVMGCKIKVFGCRERIFPIFTEGLDNRERDTKRKQYGLRAADPKVERPVSTVSGRLSRPPPQLHPVPKNLDLTVVESQPLLVVKSTSLSQSALMVLEGERTIFNITFKNLSGTDVDLLVFSFRDSTTGRIQQALAEKGNSPAEMYELELMLAKKRAFVWHRGSKAIQGASGTSSGGGGGKGFGDKAGEGVVFVPAHGVATFEVEVLGKPGLTHGSVQADYGHLGISRNEVNDKFYTRQVIFPITVTVNASIELARVDFVPFSTDLQFDAFNNTQMNGVEGLKDEQEGVGQKGQFRELFRRIGPKDDPAQYCLMLLDLRNSWPQALKIRMNVRAPSSKNPEDPESGWDDSFYAEDVLQAGHTSRVILPIKRIFLQNPSQPIPSLSANQRQFVVSTAKVSVEQERQTRESFWYREEVLDCVRGRWEEIATGRSGDIELRGIRLSPRMVETIRIEDIGIDVSVRQVEEQVRKVGPAKYLVVTDTFLTLATTLTNRTTRTVTPLLRLLPALRNQGANGGAAMDLTRRLAFNGLLQQSLRPLEPGEVRVVEIGFVALCKGEFEVSASIEEVRRGSGGRDGADRDGYEGVLGPDGIPIDVVAKMIGRKTWVSREMCVVVARDLK
ncbi:TRAPP II complex protein [Tuber magnatum]|uniref:TRAPP II complex protein n=1 Tax=Tuber magnatum TaxID=42249 RepID=A0A317STU8_9PEZI|nr:TRAPP II complex protein [Tuber magnatum]